ncbi:MAG: alpha/beta fold hydrolase, partial [Caldilineaceae bacterium]
PFTDEEGAPLAESLSEKIVVSINGVKQGMIIKSKNLANPVLLYLHGGTPDYFLSQRYPTGLDDLFTVVWWEQRGAGLSYSPDLPPESLTLEQAIADTLTVTDYLRERFGREKIYLMGHSGGTFTGIQAAALAPERYHAYIGVAQMVNQQESEKRAYDFMLAQYAADGNAAMVRRLEAAPVTSSGMADGYLALRDGAMHALGIGTMHNMRSVISGLVIESFRNREYTLAEKVNLWRAKAASGVSILWQDALATDLSTAVPSLQIPVYFLHGVYDYTCNYTLARAYLNAVDAPVKGFYSFAQSAHSPIFEEPQRVRQIMQSDVLHGTNRLADEQ